VTDTLHVGLSVSLWGSPVRVQVLHNQFYSSSHQKFTDRLSILTVAW